MKLKTLTISGFRSVRDEVKIEYGAGAFLVEGPNGAGKTSVLQEALFWLLFSTNLRGDYIEDVVNRASTAAVVSGVFEMPGIGEATMIRVRQRKGTSPPFTFLTADGTDLLKNAEAGTTTAGLRDPVERALGMSAATVRATLFYAPYRGLLTAADTARREILEEALGLDWIAGARERAAKRSKALATKELKLHDELIRLETCVSTQTAAADELRRQMAAVQANHVQEVKADLTAAEGALEEARLELARLTRQKTGATEAAIAAGTEVQRAQGKVDVANAQRLTLLGERARIAGELASFENQAQVIDGKLDHLRMSSDGTPCPYCTRPMDNASMRTALDALEADKREAAQSATRAEHQIARLDVAIGAILEMLADSGVHGHALKKARENSSELRSAVATITAAHSAKEAEIQNTLEPRVDVLTRKLAEKTAPAESISKAVGQAEAEVKAAQEQLTKTRAEYDMVQVEHRRVDWWKKAYGPKGIRAYLLEASLPSLSRLGSYYLGRMTNHALALTVSPTTTTKTGKQSERIDITIHNANGIDSTGACSAGERRAADIALTLALHDMAVSRGSRGMGLLVFDEALDALDEYRAKAVVEVLGELGRRGAAVGVISHSDAVRGHFKRALRVDRGNDGWTVLRGHIAAETGPSAGSGGGAPDPAPSAELTDMRSALSKLKRKELVARMNDERKRVHLGKDEEERIVGEIQLGKRRPNDLKKAGVVEFIIRLHQMGDG